VTAPNTKSMSRELTAVIVEDEAHCQRAIAALLERKLPDIRLLGSAATLTEGVEAVARLRPDILFLDVEIGDRSGFDLLQALGPAHPHVIFTTAHEGYALKAIRFSALDFLLKPIDANELVAAVAKVRAATKVRTDAIGMLSLINNMLHLREGILSVPTPDGVRAFAIGRIRYIDHDGERAMLHTVDAPAMPLTANLRDCEDLLGGHGFIRIQRTTLINPAHVDDQRQGAAIMSDGALFTVEPRKEDALRTARNRQHSV
jgi:two-component system LytT family response regulator